MGPLRQCQRLKKLDVHLGLFFPNRTDCGPVGSVLALCSGGLRDR